MRERSRLLRKNQTEAEIKFWNIVRKRQFHGFRFHRQFVIHSYILDFVCFQKFLIIEFDGSHHLDNKEYGVIRDDFLSAVGFTVLRFWNHELLENTDLDLEKIYHKLIELPDTLRCKKILSLSSELKEDSDKIPSPHVWEKVPRRGGCGKLGARGSGGVENSICDDNGEGVGKIKGEFI